MSEHKTIFKSASAISLMTILSRITGFVRDVLMAGIFGTGIAAEAYFVAFRIPNMFRDVIGEGAGNAAFVPVFCEHLVKKPREDFLKLVNSLFWMLLVGSCVLTILGIIFSSGIVRLIAPGFFQDKSKFDLTVALNRLLFPYLILITVSAYLMSVSNALKSFVIPAASPIVFNLVVIAALYFLIRPVGSQGVYLLGLATLLAGLVQILIQLPPLGRSGINFRKGGVYRDIFKEEALRKVRRLMLPRLAGASIYQMNVFVDTIFASLSSWVGAGAIAAIFYANRIIQFPFAVFGIALSSAALPQMSEHAARHDMEGFKVTLSFCLKSVFLIVIPLTVGILVFAWPLTQVVFQRGRFDVYSTALTSSALFFYCLGLLSYVAVRFLSHAFYALQDTATPAKTAAVGLMTNIILNALFIFVFKMRIAGLALASAIAATLNFYLLVGSIKKRTGFVFDRPFGRVILKSAVASLAVAAGAYGFWQRFLAVPPTFLKMACLVAAAGACYLGLLKAFRVRELTRLISWLRKRR